MHLTPELRTIAQGEQAPGLRAELGARWDIAESSFAAGIGRSLIDEGFSLDWATLQLTDKRRRRSVTGVTDALSDSSTAAASSALNPSRQATAPLSTTSSPTP
ncbi:hypothetical protein ACFZCY_45295 [Streptomyces sp. NPDC007983]|uniref:hypothetical protein n=1 Tax=Streptomyces sp. NPDC007983 TaxID=3364800 RepID=UPI0036F0D591